LGEYGKDNLLAGCSTQVNSRMLCSGSVAARLHEIYRECLEHSSWARIVLETSRERISFSCRKPPTVSPFQQQGRKRPATAKKRERNRRRLEEWLERRNHRSQTSPSAAAAEVTSYATAAATAALKPTVPHPALRDSVATASDKGTTAVSAPAAVSVKAAAATTAATEAVKPPPKHLKSKAAATRASERPSVVAKRRNLVQLDGCDTSAVSSKESLQKPTAATSPDTAGNPAAAPTPAPSPTPEPPDGHILCSICRIHSHDWVYSRCKLCRTKN
jgi:hypothetical protein